jgi:hypothetical protein
MSVRDDNMIMITTADDHKILCYSSFKVLAKLSAVCVYTGIVIHTLQQKTAMFSQDV